MKKQHIISVILMIMGFFLVSGCASTPTVPSRNIDCNYKSNPKTERAKEIIHRTTKQLEAIERGECD